MTARDAHFDVAGYALGVLDSWDTALFETHLAECERCRVELDALLPAASLLSDADGDAVRDLDQTHRTDRLIDAVRVERHQHRRRQVLTAAAGVGAAALAAGVSLFAGGHWLGGTTVVAGPGGPTPTAPVTAAPFGPGIGGPDLAEGERFSATDPATGVHADVVVEETGWGTRIFLALSAVSGPAVCQLVVVDADGAVESAGTWRVPAHGYGTDEHPAPLLLPAATATATAELRELKIQKVGPDGLTTLVTVPL